MQLNVFNVMINYLRMRFVLSFTICVLFFCFHGNTQSENLPKREIYAKAINSNDLSQVNKLLDYERKIQNIDSNTKLPYSFSEFANCEDFFILKYFVEKEMLSFDSYLPNGKNLFLLGCSCGDVDFIDAAITRKVDLNMHDEKGNTSLSYAIRSNNIDAVLWNRSF